MSKQQENEEETGIKATRQMTMNKNTTYESDSDGDSVETTDTMYQVTPNAQEERPIGASAVQIQAREYEGG